MCIAILKPTGAKLPSKDLLYTCWTNNPDGAGFCYNNGHDVIIHKGYMDFKTFYTALTTCAKLNNFDNKDVAIHFRISTSGGVKPENCHPFAVSNHMKKLTKTFVKCKDAFIHNGIIHGYGSKNYSDTMHYITNVIANIKDLDHSKKLINSLAIEHNSRFCVVTRNSFMLGGDWIKDNGIYYSNTSYKPRVYTYTKQYSLWPASSKTRTCDFCLNEFNKTDTTPVWDRTDKQLYYLCNDCMQFYNSVVNYNK